MVGTKGGLQTMTSNDLGNDSGKWSSWIFQVSALKGIDNACALKIADFTAFSLRSIPYAYSIALCIINENPKSPVPQPRSNKDFLCRNFFEDYKNVWIKWI